MGERPAEPPAVPAQRKLKWAAELKVLQADQTSRLQTKAQLETDLLEDIRTYTKTRAQIEKDYAQALLKVTQQLLGRFNPKDDRTDEEKTPFGLWRRMLEKSELMAMSRLEISQMLQSSIAENIKQVKTDRLVTLKKCSTLTAQHHEDMQESAVELTKAQKDYSDMEKVALQTSEQCNELNERLKKGTIGLFSSKAKLESKVSKANERLQMCEKRATNARNELLMSVAGMNAHQRKYFEHIIPDLIAMQDGEVYRQIKDYYAVMTKADLDASEQYAASLQNLMTEIEQLDRAYAVDFFLKKNSVFTKLVPYEFTPLSGDKVSSISSKFGVELYLKKEARKWVLRLAKDQKATRKKSREMKKLLCSSIDANLDKQTEGSAEVKTREQMNDSLAAEIRKLEVSQVKSEARVEAMRQAGVNVDEWVQETDDNEDETDDEDEDGKEGNFDTIAEDGISDSEFNEFDEDGSSQPAVGTPDFSDSMSDGSLPNHMVSPVMYICIYAYNAATVDELSVVEGDELELLDSEGDGWCKVRNSLKEVGYVPESYIEQMPDMLVALRKMSLASNTQPLSSSPSNPQISNSSSLDQKSIEAENPYSEISSFLPATPEESDRLGPYPVDCVCIARAIYDYEACEAEELSFMEGEMIMVVSKNEEDDGWWMGEINGKRGIFPNIVVEEVHDVPTVNQLSATYPRFQRRQTSDTCSSTWKRPIGELKRTHSQHNEHTITWSMGGPS